jgi:hypothetical protein
MNRVFRHIYKLFCRFPFVLSIILPISIALVNTQSVRGAGVTYDDLGPGSGPGYSLNPSGGGFWNWFNLPARIAEWVIKGVLRAVGFIASMVAWVFFEIAELLIRFAILLNSNLADSQTIRDGFDITLSVANLLLVVAFIAIAFMVMFRRSNAKQLLIRFIAAAVLINFGMYIITSLLIKPADEITRALFDAANISGAGFRVVFSDWFKAASTNLVMSLAGDWLVNIAVEFARTLFLVVFLFIGVITMFSLAIMFFIRYVALGILIILFPLAWVAWIFPNIKTPGGSIWGAWSEQFTRWLLFGPFAMFFVFLATKLITSPDITTDYTNAPSGGAAAAMAVGNMMMVIGLLMGGLVVANKMGIKGSQWGMKAIKHVGNIAKLNAKRLAIQGASAPLRSEGGRKMVGKMQEKRGLGFVGRQLNMAGGRAEGYLKREAAKLSKDMSAERKRQTLPTLRGLRLVEMLDSLSKDGELGKHARRYIGDPKTREEFKKHGREKDYEKLEMRTGYDTGVVHAQDTGGNVRAAMEAFHAKYKGKDESLLQHHMLVHPVSLTNEDLANKYGMSRAQYTEIRNALVASGLETMPNAVMSVRASLDRQSVDKLQEEIESKIESIELPVRTVVGWDKLNNTQRLEKVAEHYDRASRNGEKMARTLSSLYGRRRSIWSSISGGAAPPAAPIS